MNGSNESRGVKRMTAQRSHSLETGEEEDSKKFTHLGLVNELTDIKRQETRELERK